MKEIVTINDDFLKPYIRLVREVMLPYQWDALNDNIEGAEKSHSIENIRIAAGLAEGEFEGMVFQDSDVAKWIEAVAYCLQDACNAGSDTMKVLETHADETIDIIEKAQCEDGYFNTYFQLQAPERRFTNLLEAHELYCLGHFIEAAVAYANATGKNKILEIFCRFADLADSLFGEERGKRRGYPGHQEIELALARLFEATGEQRYLKLAAFFLNERGKEPHFFVKEWEEREGLSVWTNRNEPCAKEFSYSQSHKPVREQTEAVGHAVRAMYMYTAMAEVGRLNGDDSLISACRVLFDDICKQLYVTGGVGSTNHGEAFTFAYDLPNDINYSETCASIGLIFFMRSLFKAELFSSTNAVRSVYADVMERALYNTVLASISTDGKSYFYVNPMEIWPEASLKNPARTHVAAQRQKWHKCACCPPNAARLLASLREYLYTVDAFNNTVYFQLYAASEFIADFDTGTFEFSVQTAYPLDGAVSVNICSAAGNPVTMAFRIPLWHKNDFIVTINGEATDVKVNDGYAYLSRVFKPGDIINFSLDMSPRFVRANSHIRATAGKVCLQRGPLVYCLEECDNGNNLSALITDTSADMISETSSSIGGMPCILLTVKGYREINTDDEMYTFDRKQRKQCELTFVPYHLWGNRTAGEMLVWVREV